MSSSTFSTLVQTKSIKQVLSPIATQVSNLIYLNDKGPQNQHGFQDFVASAEHIFNTVQALTDTGCRLAQETYDEQLRCDMPKACSQVLEAGNNLLSAARQLRVDPNNESIRTVLGQSARKVLEYTVNVLLTSDDAEVRKIICEANTILKILWDLMKFQTWLEFRKYFQIFHDRVSQFMRSCEMRRNELVSPVQQEVISASMDMVLKAEPKLLSISHEYLQNPNQITLKAARDNLVGEILKACTQIMQIVETKTSAAEYTTREAAYSQTWDGGGNENLSQKQIRSKSSVLPSTSDNLDMPSPSVLQSTSDDLDRALPSGLPLPSDDLDYYLDAIVRNSLAVAEKCENQKRKIRIAQACHEVLETRNELNKAQEVLSSKPMSERLRNEFDLKADKLQQCLRSLDCRVTMSIIADMCTVFSDVDTPLHNVVTAATISLPNDSLLNYNQAMSRLKQSQQAFLGYSERLCHAASNASSVAAEPHHVYMIRSVIGQIEAITPQIIGISSEVRQQPQNGQNVQNLKALQQAWRKQVDTLSDLSLHSVTSADFLDTTEALSRECLIKCQDALTALDFEKLTQEITLLVGMSQKAVQVCVSETQRTADPLFKGRLTDITSRVNSVLPEVASLSTEVICHIHDSRNHVKFLEQAMVLVDKLGEMRSVVKRSPLYLKDNSFQDVNHKQVAPPSIYLSHTPTGYHSSQEISNVRLTPSPLNNTNSGNSRSGLVGRNSPVDEIALVRNGSSLTGRDSGIVLNTGNVAANNSPVSQLSPGVRKNRASHDIESYVEETRRCLLLGLVLVEADDIQMLRKLSALLRSSPKSLMSRLLDAVSQSDYALVERRCNELARRAASLKDFVDEPALRRAKNKEVSSVAINKSSEVYESTADVVQLAWKVAANPGDAKASSQLRLKCDKWSEELDIVRATVDKLVNPWSAFASCVVIAITLKDQKLLLQQIKNFRVHVLRLRELASSAKAAADAEDAVDVSGEGEVPARNPDSLKRIELVMVKSAEMDELTNRFIIFVKEIMKNFDKSPDFITLEFLRRDWACKVQSLIFAVDDITAGTSAPVDGICTAALHGNAQVVRDRGKLLNTYIVNLKEMADGCSAYCRDKEKANKAQETVECVVELTQKFQDAVLIVRDKVRGDMSTVEASLSFTSHAEKMVLLQREWSAKVHLFTSLIDDMTADVSAHVDRLAGAALNVSRVDRNMKLEYLRDFEGQSNKLSSKVARVRNHACLTISNSADEEKVRMVRVTCDFLDRLTPQVIAAARGLADNPDQPTVEHFQMLRRQWSSRAHFLMANLKGLKNVQYSSVEAITKELLGSHDDTEQRNNAMYTYGHTLRDTALYYNSPIYPSSSNGIHSNGNPVYSRTSSMKGTVATGDRVDVISTKERIDDLKDSLNEIDGLVTSLSDFALQTQKSDVGPQDCSIPSSEASSLLSRYNCSQIKPTENNGREMERVRDQFDGSQDSLLRIDSTESLDETDMSRPFYGPAVIRRTSSLDGLSKPWRTNGLVDVKRKKSSFSIARAAAHLRDETEKWEDENNSFVRVSKSISRHMFTIADITRKRSSRKDTYEMMKNAENIVSECRVIFEFVKIIAGQCADQQSKESLLRLAQAIRSLGTRQLSIVSSMKCASQDRLVENIIVRSAHNLTNAIVQTMRAVERAVIKGLSRPSETDDGHVEETSVVFEWKRKLKREKSLEATSLEQGNVIRRMRDKSLSNSSLVTLLDI